MGTSANRVTKEETTIGGLRALSITPVGGSDRRAPVLLLHGAFATHACFERWMERLAGRGHRTIAISFRGRLGVGPEAARGLRVTDYVDDALAAIDALGTHPIVVGHSMGGLVAQKVAEAGRASAVVLVAPAPASRLDAQPRAIPALLPLVPRILLGQPLIPSCSTCEQLVLHNLPEAERAGAHDALVHESGAAYRDMIFGRVRVDATKVKVPVLVVGGDEDRVISEVQLRETATRFGARLDVRKGHAHWLLAEPGWERIVDDVACWMESSDVAHDPVVSARPSSQAVTGGR